MADQSFLNPIKSQEVSLAIERLLVAPFGTTWDNTRITLSNSAIPAGFRDLGAVVEDSVALTVSREVFSLPTGIPRILQYQAVLGLTGRFQAVLHSNSPRKVAYGLGNTDAVNTLDNSIQTVSNTVVPSYTQVMLSNSPAAALNVGDLVVADSSATTLTVSDNETYVTSISGGTIYLSSPGFPTLPMTGWKFSKVTSVKQPYGTALIKQYRVLGVADFIDGIQVVHDLQKAQIGGGDYTETLRPTENARVIVNFALLGYSASGYEGSNHLVLGERFFFPKAT